jgi:hypothetical protein
MMAGDGSPSSTAQWVVASLAILAFGSTVVQAVWSSSRTDIATLESRLERAVSQLDRQLNETKENDKLLLPKEVHIEFKSQIERQIFRNTGVIDDLLVRKEVFERALSNQKVKDDMSHAQQEKELDMLRAGLSALRQHQSEVDRYLRDHK